MSRYVIVHGAWHTGKELEPVANFINSAGHNAHTPTIKGTDPETRRRSAWTKPLVRSSIILTRTISKKLSLSATATAG